MTATQAVAEIDELFAGLSRHKQTVAAAAAATAAAEAKKKKKEQELKQKKAEMDAREAREGQKYDPKRDDPDVRPCKYSLGRGGERGGGRGREGKNKIPQEWIDVDEGEYKRMEWSEAKERGRGWKDEKGK